MISQNDSLILSELPFSLLLLFSPSFFLRIYEVPESTELRRMRRVAGPADFSCTHENSPVSAATRSKKLSFVGRWLRKKDRQHKLSSLLRSREKKERRICEERRTNTSRENCFSTKYTRAILNREKCNPYASRGNYSTVSARGTFWLLNRSRRSVWLVNCMSFIAKWFARRMRGCNLRRRMHAKHFILTDV